jgi:hypothetical protein
MEDWQSIKDAPFDLDLELAVLDGEEVHALVFLVVAPQGLAKMRS